MSNEKYPANIQKRIIPINAQSGPNPNILSISDANSGKNPSIKIEHL